jgi:hypothetical protein
MSLNTKTTHSEMKQRKTPKYHRNSNWGNT